MQPGVGKIADLVISQYVGEAHDSGQGGHDQADSQQPQRGASPEIAGGLPERQVGDESQNETRDRKRNKHGMDGMSGDLSRRLGVWHEVPPVVTLRPFNFGLSLLLPRQLVLERTT